MRNDCALVAITATTGITRDKVDSVAEAINMVNKIEAVGTAAFELKRLLRLLGHQVHAEYVDTGTLGSWLKDQEWRGFKHGIYCVSSGRGTFHAVSLGPRGYVDLLDRDLNPGDRRPKKGLRRKVRWLLRW